MRSRATIAMMKCLLALLLFLGWPEAQAQRIPDVFPAFTYDRKLNDSVADELYKQYSLLPAIADSADRAVAWQKLASSQMGYSRRGISRALRIPLIATAVGCGFYECLEPRKLKATRDGRLQRDTVLYDFFMNTVWQTANWQRSRIRIYFPHSQSRVNTLIFYAGNFKNDTAWRQDHRLKKALLKVNGRKVAMLHFKDCMCEQELQLPQEISCRRRTKVTIIPLEVYPGPSGLLSVSEINFDGVNCH